jgi:hypothetical protein
MTVADSCLRATGQPALRQQERYTGFYSERERLFIDVRTCFAGMSLRRQTIGQKTYSSYCNSILPQAGDAINSVGQSHSSVEVSVMEMERRALVI